MTMIASNGPGAIAERCRTAADWLHELGDVPLERILFDPLPGTATEEDVIRKVDAAEKQLCELVDQTLVEKAMGTYESLLAGFLYQDLMNFIRPRKLGVAVPGDGPLRLKLGLVRIPDISYISASRLPGGKFPRKPIAPLVPDLVVEVLSPSNTAGEMARKLRDYFDAGVRLVWLIDPIRRIATIHASSSGSTEIGVDGLLDGGAVVPGFALRLGALFDAADEQYGG